MGQKHTHENKTDFFVKKIRFTHVFMVQLGYFFLLLIKKNSLRTTDVKDIQAILKCCHSFIGALILPGQRKTSTDSGPSLCRCGLPVSE